MKQYNVTAQVYNKYDQYKQTLLMNRVIDALSEDDAIDLFHKIFLLDYKILKIYSVEEIPQVAA
jgi:ribosomal protein L20A (L18A)